MMTIFSIKSFNILIIVILNSQSDNFKKLYYIWMWWLLYLFGFCFFLISYNFMSEADITRQR
jgi:hypothetical protein